MRPEMITNSEPESHKWFALQVRTRWESSTSVLLEGKGYKTLVPTHKTRRSWTGKTREVIAPLFPGYVFCNFDPQKRLPILITPGVLSVVSSGRIPLPVDDAEIAGIQTVIASGCQAEPWPYLEVGQRIRIENDSLRGLEGILIQFKGNHRIVVSVSLLRRSVALEIDRCSVSPLDASKNTILNPISARDLLQGVVA
jgi:transcription antitermination factor NusG